MNKPLSKLLGGLLSALTRGTTQPPPTQAKDRPMPPCGDPEEHYYWSESAAMPCPLCERDNMRQHEQEEEDRVLRKLAKLIAAEMKNHDQLD